jgi:hypothetical protein
MLLLGHRYKYHTVVITNGLTVTKYHSRHHELVDRYEISHGRHHELVDRYEISHGRHHELVDCYEISHGRHHELVDRYEISISQMTMDLVLFTLIFPCILSSSRFVVGSVLLIY